MKEPVLFLAIPSSSSTATGRYREARANFRSLLPTAIGITSGLLQPADNPVPLLASPPTKEQLLSALLEDALRLSDEEDE